MWAVGLIVVAVLGLFVLIDIKAAAIFDLFAGRSYDLVAQVAPGTSPNGNGNLRGLEYVNKNKILNNK